MRVCDSYADGWAVVVVALFLKTTDDKTTYTKKYKWHTGGSGGTPCTDRSYGNLPEYCVFYFQTCLGKYSEGLINGDSCGPLSVVTA